MPTTIRELLRDDRFRLRLVVEAPELLDAPIVWVHSSDLPDPTPWLEAGHLLLTDGDQLRPSVGDGVVEEYVSRLREGGILGLGFATGIIHDAIPHALVAACEKLGLPLFEVADRTPFMAIIRHVADISAGDQRERLEWSLAAQRSLARAALRPDGLQAILRELENRLGCWVALYDGLGDRVRTSAGITMPEELRGEVDDAVRLVLSRGTRSGARLSAAGGEVTLQTLGQRDNLRGVLAVGTRAPLDPAGNDLVASVIALASISLEQSRSLEAARLDLRTGLLELLLAGSTEVAQRTAERLWGRLPAEPVRLSVTPMADVPVAFLTELELFAERNGARLFFAQRDEELILVSHDEELVPGMLGRHRLLAGASAPVEWRDLGRSLDEARRSLGLATTDRAFVRFDDMAGEGMLGLLERAGAAEVARRTLEPLTAGGRADAQLLLVSAATWLHFNGGWDPASRRLQVHRHTLRARLTLVEEALSLDLSRFADRAELWAALRFGGIEPLV
jgi:purine catabolism regulator